MLLTIDLGTSATKVTLWSEHGAVAAGRADIATFHPQPGWAEQDPDDWWASVVEACTRAKEAADGRWADVEAVGFAAARSTFVPADDEGRPLGRGLLWSDTRAKTEAAHLARTMGGIERFHQRTGLVPDAGCTAAK